MWKSSIQNMEKYFWGLPRGPDGHKGFTWQWSLKCWWQRDQTLMIVPVIGFGRGLLYFGGGLTRKKEERKKEISLALMKSRRARHFRWSKKTQKMHKFKSFHLYQLVIAFDLPKKLQQEYDETFVKYIGQCTCHVFKRVRLRVATL